LLGHLRNDSRIARIQYETEWERITGSAIELEIAKLEEKVRDDITLQAEILTAGKESLETETNELLLQFEKHFLEKRFQELLIELRKQNVIRIRYGASSSSANASRFQKRSMILKVNKYNL
jgi:hypothetical protein